MDPDPKPSSEKCDEPSSLGVDVEVRCIECFDVLWVTKASQDGEPRVPCPFKIGNSCKLIAKGCNCG